MKIFVFMYPLMGHFLNSIEGFDGAFEHGILTQDDISGINRLVEARYRANGYRVLWVLYGKKGSLHTPLVEGISPFVRYRKGDGVISSGTQGKHPNCEFIVNQLPEKIDHLVVGGFHWQFCPRELAEYALSLGIKSVVDEDTTQAYFSKLLFHRLSEGNMAATYPVEGIQFVPYMGASSLEEQIGLYHTLERWPFLARAWDQENYSLRDRGGTLTMPKEAFHKIFGTSQ